MTSQQARPEFLLEVEALALAGDGR